jgi:hypothetical protein
MIMACISAKKKNRSNPCRSGAKVTQAQNIVESGIHTELYYETFITITLHEHETCNVAKNICMISKTDESFTDIMYNEPAINSLGYFFLHLLPSWGRGRVVS